MAITKMQEKREVKVGDSILEGIRQLQEKALELLGKMEEDGDYRGAILAAREARESLLSANELLAHVGGSSEMLVRIIHIGAKDVNAALDNQRLSVSL